MIQLLKKNALLLLSLTLLFGLSACGEEESEESPSMMMSEADMGAGAGGVEVGDGSWNAVCESDDDCAGDSPYCVLNPMTPGPGYCSVECRSSTECTGAEMDWTCNVIGGCENPVVTWCGPQSEVEENAPVLVACP